MMNKLKQLKEGRKKYININWISKKKIATKITDLDDNYLLNCLRVCIEKELVGKRVPAIKELNIYENLTYTKWIEYFQNEVLFRKAMVEERYKEYIEEEIYKQSEYDREYYKD